MNQINVDKALKWARRHCDWQDIDDMAMLVEGIEKSRNFWDSMILYRNGIAYIMGYRIQKPEGFDAHKITKARRAVRTWAMMQGLGQ